MVKNPSFNARDTGDASSIPGWRRSPGGGNGNPLQHSHLGNPMDRRAWQATVHGAAKRWTWRSNQTATTRVGNPAAHAGDMGALPGPGTCPMPQGN